jgi:hypothetical protein
MTGKDAARAPANGAGVDEIELNAKSIARQGLDALSLEVGERCCRRVWSTRGQPLPGAAHGVERMNLQEARSLVERKAGYPIELVKIVLRQGKDKREGHARPSNAFQARGHGSKRLRGASHSVVGCGHTVQTDREEIQGAGQGGEATLVEEHTI